ncbi:hypothetical protein POPTR_008G008801v4 [Populus trichocarpa]|uniref:Uncharacterized protein n=1 Tax=Populus trichocarpa TaxID=3694 RepID=A0ACC0SIW0_POPTR|nr:hypothetical protein BDE02_08G005900 [Populus trichocarpa]KAI9389157.1 hypothetical protein POPTR_008G008801v4 [Populus trichocarpa]
MHLQNQSLTTLLPLPFLFLPKPTKPHQFTTSKQQDPPATHVVGSSNDKPFPAEVSRTIMELSSVGTLSTPTPDGWPLSVGVRYAVDDDGTPVLCLSDSYRQFSVDKRSSLHVQLEQSGMRTPQCTIQGSLDKPEDTKVLKVKKNPVLDSSGAESLRMVFFLHSWKIVF